MYRYSFGEPAQSSALALCDNAPPTSTTQMQPSGQTSGSGLEVMGARDKKSWKLGVGDEATWTSRVNSLYLMPVHTFSTTQLQEKGHYD